MANEPTQVVVISDLHIDTWLNGDHGPEKQQGFLDFLRFIEPDTRELYVNGDLLDMPPYEYSQADLMARFGAVLNALYAFSRRRSVFWLAGNHDIGVAGARLVIPGITVWYPGIRYRPPGQQELHIMIEHGHLYDPALALYAKDAGLLSYYGKAADQPLEDRETVRNLMLQRRQADRTKSYAPGLLTQRAKDGGVIEWVKRECAPLLRRYYTVKHWREQAGIAARQHSNLAGDVDVMVFGHTHCPDTETVKWRPKVPYSYYNTGSWTESEPCMPYLVIADDGQISRRCFRVREAMHLKVDQCGPEACLARRAGQAAAGAEWVWRRAAATPVEAGRQKVVR